MIFTLLSFWYGVKGREYWAQCVCCYFLGFFGDVVDGHVARMFDQSKPFDLESCLRLCPPLVADM